jgi:hypothetical protein
MQAGLVTLSPIESSVLKVSTYPAWRSGMPCCTRTALYRAVCTLSVSPHQSTASGTHPRIPATHQTHHCT